MKAYQAGDSLAFEKLYHQLKPRLLQYLMSQTLHRTPAEDLLQETFLQMHRSRRSYLPDKPVLPWAFAIARHVYLMDRRRDLRRQEKELAVRDDLPELPIPPEVDTLAEHDLDEEAFERLAVLSGVKQFPIRVKCATLAWHTMQAALQGEAEATTE